HIADPNRVAAELANDSHAVSLDENASPAEKARAALAQGANVPGGAKKQAAETSGAGMVSDIGGQRVKATTNLAEIERINQLEKGNVDAKDTAAPAAGVQLDEDVSIKSR
ncbi:hypothetical protein OC844_007675, partial [Tilletia horrida]